MSAEVLVIGIDCASPELIFDRWAGRLPVLESLMAQGIHGPLRSTDPPITVPAWASMLTGMDPGRLGIYGFHKRVSAEPFDRGGIVTSRDIEHPWVWEILGEAGRQSLVMGVPPTWPPRPMRGRLVTDFLTPDTSAPHTWPPDLAERLDELGGGPYLLDVVGHRTNSPAAVIEQAREMAFRRFSCFSRLLEESSYSLAMVMEIGLDRMQHALWHLMDPAHPRYPGPGGEWEDALFEYHLLLDELIGGAVEAAGDGAHVLVVSDHGAQPMMGGVRINEWLRREGWLTIEAGPRGESPDRIPWGTPLSSCVVNWEASRAFAEGGYCGRVFLNLQGRQPRGAVPPGRFEDEIQALSRGIEAIAGPDGKPLAGTKLLRPSEIYPRHRGAPPDLFVYFGDLGWRALGSIGTAAGEVEIEDPRAIVCLENDTGPDGANHAMEGVFVLREAGAPARGRVEGLAIHDVFQTILGLLGVQAPAGAMGEARHFAKRGRHAPS